MNPATSETGVVAAVIDQGGRVLLAKRPHHKRYGGKWEFPGGKCETGESHSEAISRELMEELGVTVVSTEVPEFIITDRSIALTIYYIPTTVVGTAQAREHDALAWVADEDLLDYDLAPTDRSYAEYRISRAGC